mmetsp:Transcript_28097/g.59861  ORF Transcript_28097/g.59861 Transcript_28097/m.59861 type:complete len:479 (-) Transcript_28097:653-2089(-)
MFSVIASAIFDSFGTMFSSTYFVFWIYFPYWIAILTALAVSPLTILLPQFLKGDLSWPNIDDVKDEWIINGKRYNLKPFYDSHPGGSFALRAARGSDCTGLVESYHIFIERDVFMKMIARFEIKDAPPAEPPKVVYSDPFYEDLKKSVREHFKGQPRSAHKMTWLHIGLCVLAWVSMWVLIYLHLVKDQMWAIPFIGLLSWYLTGNVMHDSTHNAFVTTPWVNRLCSHAAFPYGVNVAGWQIQHVLSHHIYTNEEEDVDLYHYEPVMFLDRSSGSWSLSPAFHALRLVYMLSSSIPHLALVVPYGLALHQIDPAHGHRMYDRVKAINSHRAELRWCLIGEALCLFGFYGIVYSYQGLLKGICSQMSIYVISSYLFGFFTQVSHLQEECFVEPKKREELSFAMRQVKSSMDFAADSLFWGHFSGGLNTQALHHCLPGISAMHLRALYPRFREVCRKHNVELKEAPSLGEFVTGFVTFCN